MLMWLAYFSCEVARFARRMLPKPRSRETAQLMYPIPMHEVSVLVALSGVEPEEYLIYLAHYSDQREGPETLGDYLNGRRRFFPMVSAGAPKMINRDQIVWVRCARLEPTSDLDVTIVERLAIFELFDGNRIEGTMPIDRPRDQSRISDVLNDPYEWFVRIDDDTSTSYVNKRFIRQVIPR